MVNYFVMNISLGLMSALKQKQLLEHKKWIKKPCVFCHSYVSHFQRYS